MKIYLEEAWKELKSLDEKWSDDEDTSLNSRNRRHTFIGQNMDEYDSNEKDDSRHSYKLSKEEAEKINKRNEKIFKQIEEFDKGFENRIKNWKKNHPAPKYLKQDKNKKTCEGIEGTNVLDQAMTAEDYFEDMGAEEGKSKYKWPEPIELSTEEILELTGHDGRQTYQGQGYVDYYEPYDYDEWDVPVEEEIEEAYCKEMSKKFAELNNMDPEQVLANEELQKAFVLEAVEEWGAHPFDLEGNIIDEMEERRKRERAEAEIDDYIDSKNAYYDDFY